jgi:hypothetical protein
MQDATGRVRLLFGFGRLAANHGLDPSLGGGYTGDTFMVHKVQVRQRQHSSYVTILCKQDLRFCDVSAKDNFSRPWTKYCFGQHSLGSAQTTEVAAEVEGR